MVNLRARIDYDDKESATQGTGGMQVNHTPWTQEQAEKWAMESDVVRKATFEDDAIEGFKAGMAKAAEMINEAPTVHIDRDSVCTHIAKLVGVRPIEGEK